MTLRILGLQAENFKRLRAVSIKPDGSLVEIRGKNGQGKSSVLDAIWAALAGKAAVPIMPIRKGAEEARIRLDLGEIVVLRTFRTGKDGDVTTTLSVTAADGARYGSPQSMLDKLYGSLSFDPLAYTRLKPREQFDQLKALVPGVDFDLIQRQQDGDMEKRRDINRQAQQARAAATVINVPDGTPAEPIDDAALVAELEKAGETNTEIERRRANRVAAAEAVAHKVSEGNRLRARADELLAEAGRLHSQAEQLSADANDLQTKIDNAEALPTPVDTSALRQQITDAQAKNEHVRKAKEKAAHLARAKVLEAQSEQLTANMQARHDDKLAKIAAAQLPVAGIGFGEGEILLNGVPFQQASSAEQLRTSIAIAAAMNPKLPVIVVRDGSLLDEDSLRLISEFAEAKGLQVWMEIVDSKATTGVIIEDGAVREAAQGEAA